jgi:hypothetical protein
MRIARRTSVPKYSDYRRYKSILREDFRYCCAYCATHEITFGALRHMTIDHFRPKGLQQFAHLIAEYGNLYYCCGECNTYKGDRWPSETEFEADLRFVDVCAEDLFDHIAAENGVIVGQTPPGKFTVANLRLDRPAMTERNREISRRFVVKCTELERVRKLSEIAKASGDELSLQELEALRQELLAELHDIIFPARLIEK